MFSFFPPLSNNQILLSRCFSHFSHLLAQRPQDDTDPFADFTASVVARVPEINVPWLNQSQPTMQQLLSDVTADGTPTPDRGSSPDADPNSDESKEDDSSTSSNPEKPSVVAEERPSSPATPQLAPLKRKHSTEDEAKALKREKPDSPSVPSPPRTEYMALNIHTTASNPAKQMKKAQRKKARQELKKKKKSL